MSKTNILINKNKTQETPGTSIIDFQNTTGAESILYSVIFRKINTFTNYMNNNDYF